MIFMYRWMINHCRNTDSTERTLPRSDKTRTLKKSFTRRAQHHLTSARPQDTPKSVKHHQLGPERDISSVTPEVYTNESTSYSCRTHLLVLQHIMGYNPTFYSQNQSIYQPATTSGKLQVRNKKGSREKKNSRRGKEGRHTMRGRVFLWIPSIANKQAASRWVQRNTEKQLDNGVDYAAVVKWSGKLLGLVGRSPQERWGNRKREREVRDTPRSFPCWGEGNDIQQCPFHRIVRKHKNEKWKGGTRKKRGTTAERRGKIQYNICFVITNYLIIIIMRKWRSL